jgi:Bacterial Ig-like domain/Bacterial Ig domain
MKNLRFHVIHLALALSLVACGGGGGGSPEQGNIGPVVNQNPLINPNTINNPNPIVNPNPSPVPNPTPTAVVTPTVAFITPASDIYFTGGMNVEVAVTGAPDKVEFYKNGVLEATVAAPPYGYYWQNGSEPEGVYTLTAKAVKTGTADVVSAARVVTVDRTNPTLVSRLPADGATNVQRTDEISVTMSEPMLASTVNATTVRLLVGGAEVGSTAVLDATGKKIRIAFNTPPALPATVTVAISGLTDLAGKLNDPIADARFVMVAPALGSPTAIISLSSSTITRAYGSSRTSVEAGGFTIVNVNLRDYPSYYNYQKTLLIINGKADKLGTYYLNPDPVKCPIGLCTYFQLDNLNSYNNGNVMVKVRFRFEDGSTLDSPEVPLTIDIPNLENQGRLFDNWIPDPGNVGTVGFVGVPAIYTNNSLFLGLESYKPQYSLFIKHDSVALNGVTGGLATFRKRFPLVLAYEQGADFNIGFKALIQSTSGNSDRIYGAIRSCKPGSVPNLPDCTVWNSLRTFGDTLLGGPPYLSGSTYIEVELTFDSSGPTGTFLMGNMFLGS